MLLILKKVCGILKTANKVYIHSLCKSKNKLLLTFSSHVLLPPFLLEVGLRMGERLLNHSSLNVYQALLHQWPTD